MLKEKKVSVVREEHHRRPRSLDGNNSPANTSFVGSRDHKAWHVLMGNMNAYQIRDFLNHRPKEYKPKNLKVTCRFINGIKVVKRGENNSHKETKIEKAWRRLFEGMSFQEIIAYINSVWLDSSYHFYVRKVKNN